MRFQFALTAVTVLMTLQASAFTYPSGNAQLSKPIQLPDASGKLITVTSGPVSLKLGGRPMWGSDTLTLRTVQGDVVLKIAKANYIDGWSFMLPAQGNVALTLKGTASDKVVKAAPRHAVVDCEVDAFRLPVLDGANQPYMVTDDQGNKQQLILNLCSQSVNGHAQISQSSNFDGTCNGTKEVLMQASTSTQTYTIEVLDPATGDSIGQIVMTADVSQYDSVAQTISPCH